MSFPPANSTRVPCSSSGVRVSSTRRETDAMEGSASPRNPSVPMESRSSAVRSFDVAWRSKASSASSRFMPVPSSITRISCLPPDSTSMRIERAPASSEFSSSSFTTDAGRSTTSPAAMRFATFSASIRILLMRASELIRRFAGSEWELTIPQLSRSGFRGVGEPQSVVGVEVAVRLYTWRNPLPSGP